MDDMLTRMAALTGHLKTLARKSPTGLRERLDLAAVVDQRLSCSTLACATNRSAPYRT